MPTAERPVALITGASRGIGRATAIELGRTHHILVGGTDPATVDEVVRQLPSAQPWVVDLSDADALATAISGIERLDVLVHAAGIAIEKPVTEVTSADWQRSFAVNLFSVAQIVSGTITQLRAGGGIVVLINSGSGMFSYADGSPYTETKYALRNFANNLREEQRESGVRVTSIHPGAVDTEMGRAVRANRGIAYDPKYYVQPETIASAVRVAVDAPAAAQFETMSIRPTHLQPGPTA